MDANARISRSRVIVAAILAIVLAAALVPSAAFAAQVGDTGQGGSAYTAAQLQKAAPAAPAKTTKKSIAKAKVTLSKSTYTYSGSKCKPKVTVKLGKKKLAAKYYKVTYKNNVKAGKATVVVTGRGAYTGTATKTFTIKKKSLSKAKLTLSRSYTCRINGAYLCSKKMTKAEVPDVVWQSPHYYCSYTYPSTFKGVSVEPAASVSLAGKKLKKGTDYTVTYRKNTTVGYGVIAIAGKGNYSGKVSKKFSINSWRIVGSDIGVSAGEPWPQWYALSCDDKQFWSAVSAEDARQQAAAYEQTLKGRYHGAGHVRVFRAGKA